MPQIAAVETKKIASNLLDTYPDVFKSIQNTKVKGIISNIVHDVKDYGVNTGLVNAKGFPIIRKVTPEFSFEDLWALRKGIGQEIGDASTETARGQFKALYHAVSDDMDVMFSQSQGKGGNLFKQANQEWKRLSLKFDAVREAYDKATGTIKGKEMGGFSSKTFATELKNLANDPKYKGNIKWDAKETDYMIGLAKIMEATKRTGQYMENPPTGNRWGLPIILGSIGSSAMTEAALGHPVLAAGKAGGTLSLILVGKFLTGTPAGQRLAMAGSRAEPTSPAMQLIVRQIYSQLPRYAAALSTEQQEVSR